MGLSRAWYRIRKRAGLDDVRLHDQRHTYAYLASHPVQEAAERIGSEVTAAMRGGEGGEVRQFVR